MAEVAVLCDCQNGPPFRGVGGSILLKSSFSVFGLGGSLFALPALQVFSALGHRVIER